jgi:phosphate transport system substrate-binding protein
MLRNACTAGAAALAIVGSGHGQSPDYKALRGSVVIDGSSTVYPITEAVAEAFADVAPQVRVTVAVSGTGGGFKRFIAGETDISNASRPIKKNELDMTTTNKVEFVEVPVAYDGLTIVVNKSNTWVDNLSVDDLKRIFLDGSTVKTWQDVRPTWPDTEIKIYAPGTDSGTFDYFKEIVAGSEGNIRSDMSVSEDDNVLVRGVSGDSGALGFFGCAYYFENAEKLRAIPIINPKTKAAVALTVAAVESGEYAPLSRPLFIYVNSKSLATKPQVKAFVDFYLAKGPNLVKSVGYVQLPKEINEVVQRNVAAGKTGTQFLSPKGEAIHGALNDVYR